MVLLCPIARAASSRLFLKKRERERLRGDSVSSSKTGHLLCHRAVIMMQLWRGWAELGGGERKGLGQWVLKTAGDVIRLEEGVA